MIIPTSKWDLIMRSVTISSYLPGRICLYSKKLVGNADLGRRSMPTLPAIKKSIKSMSMSSRVLS